MKEKLKQELIKEAINKLDNPWKNLTVKDISKDLKMGENLTNELFNNIAKQKKDGTFDYEKIKNTITQIMPYLNAEQQKNLLSILEKIK